MALTAAVTVLIARLLGPEDLGTYTFVVVASSIGLIPVGNGWGMVTLRTTAAASADLKWSSVRGLIKRSVRYATICSLGALGFGMIIAAAIGIRPASTLHIIVLTAIILFFDQMSAVRSHYLRGIDRPALALAPETLIRPLVCLSVLAILWWLLGEKLAVLHAVFALLVGALASFFIGACFAHEASAAEFLSTPATYEDRFWLVSAATLALSAGLSVINAYVDVLILGILTSAEEVGVYRAAAQMAVLGGFGYVALNMIACQQFAHFRSSNDLVAAQRVATFLCAVAFLSSLVLPVVLITAGPVLVIFVFGSPFENSYEPMLLLAAGQVLNAACGMNNALLVMHEEEKRVAKLAVLSILLNVVFCMVLIPNFGIYGAACASLIANGCWNILTALFGMRCTGINVTILSLFLQDSSFKLNRH